MVINGTGDWSVKIKLTVNVVILCYIMLFLSERCYYLLMNNIVCDWIDFLAI